MTVEEYDMKSCDFYSGYNQRQLICLDCIRKWIRDAKEHDADYVGEHLLNKIDALEKEGEKEKGK